MRAFSWMEKKDLKKNQLKNKIASNNFTVINCDEINKEEKIRERTVADIPHKCKFCGKEMRLFKPDVLAQMQEDVKTELGNYTCDCEGYHKYFITVIQERKAQLEFQKAMYLINKARQEIFLESAFYKDAVKLSQIRAKAQKKVDQLKETESKKEKYNQLENYFNSVNEFNEGRGNILDYYFWPMFNTGGQNNESK